jgi:Tetratricopeptide repeat
MPLADDLAALAALAGNSVVAAAATDAWESVRHGVARLFGRGGPAQAKLAGRRLEETRGQLAAVTGAQLEQTRAVLAQRWAGRLADLLEQDPDAEAGLRALVGQVQAQLVSAADHSAAAGRDLAIEASGGGMAAGVMHASAIAGPGGTAIGRMEYQRLPVASQPVSLPPRPVFLAGREDLLAELDAQLSAGEGRRPRIVALCGLGGAGKTSVAVEYAHRNLGEAGLAWQFPAEDPTVLLAEFARLARLLGAQDPVAPGDPVASVHGVLAAYAVGWLVVFDNAPDRASVERFLPPAGPGRVLITSQSALWPTGQTLDVPVLDVEVAAAFLVGRTGDPDKPTAVTLAGELGGLPLALEQAAAYIQASGTTLAGYLSLFRDRRADLLARGEAAGHPAHVAATLGLALSRLGDDAPAAAGLARLLACLAPEPVPLALLLAGAEAAGELDPSVAAAAGPLLGDRVAVGDAVAALRRYSLVAPAGDGLVLVHRLVQAVTLAQVLAEAAGQWEQAAAALVEAAVPADTRLPVTWSVCAVLLPHARAVLDLTSGGIWRIADYLGYSGSYLAARDLFQLIADAHREDDAYGPEHPDTLAARHNLAYWAGQAGDAAGARDQFAALLPLFERVLGAEHPDTLTTRGNLARWAGLAGDAAGARDQYTALLPVIERVSGAEHPDTLAARHELARWAGQAGDAAGARDQYAALLPVHERVLGAEHPDTLTARHELARWAGQAGDAAGARDRYAALLPLFERVLGAEHPDTLTTRGNLAYWAGQAGDAAGARDQFAALLSVAERVLGAEHPGTLTARGNLAFWTGQAALGRE